MLRCSGRGRRAGGPPPTPAELTFGRRCWRPVRRPPASSSGRRSCLPAAPPSGCCRFSGCSLGSRTLKPNQMVKTPVARCLSSRVSLSPPPGPELCTCSPVDPSRTREEQPGRVCCCKSKRNKCRPGERRATTRRESCRQRRIRNGQNTSHVGFKLRADGGVRELAGW